MEIYSGLSGELKVGLEGSEESSETSVVPSRHDAPIVMGLPFVPHLYLHSPLARPIRFKIPLLQQIRLSNLQHDFNLGRHLYRPSCAITPYES
jgi:hypothetical protein